MILEMIQTSPLLSPHTQGTRGQDGRRQRIISEEPEPREQRKRGVDAYAIL